MSESRPAGYSIVMIDDDPEFLAGTEMYLRSEGFQVFACARSSRALQLIRRLEPDAVLLDQDMPEATGLEILERLRGMSLTRSIPVLFLTASRDPELVSRGFRGGVDDYISKPFRGEELALRLRAVIGRAAGEPGAGRREDANALPSNFQGRVLILQTTNFAAFEHSGHEARAELRGAQRRLVHRLRDTPGRRSARGEVDPRESMPMRRRRDGIVLLFPGPDQAREDRLRRALNAANRLPVMNREKEFLAPASRTDPTLVRFPWPRFRLLDARLSGNGISHISKLLEALALELEGRSDYQIVDL